jgi:hypothetical protein
VLGSIICSYAPETSGHRVRPHTHTYVQTSDTTRLERRDRVSADTPHRARDAAAHAATAPLGDRAPAVERCRAHAMRVGDLLRTRRCRKPAAADGRGRPPRASRGRVHKARAPAARGGHGGRARRAHSGGNGCGWRPRRPRPPGSTPRSRRARRVLQTHRTRTNQQGCGESGQVRKCTRAVRGRWQTCAATRRDAHVTPSGSSARSTTPAHHLPQKRPRH